MATIGTFTRAGDSFTGSVKTLKLRKMLGGDGAAVLRADELVMDRGPRSDRDSVERG